MAGSISSATLAMIGVLVAVGFRRQRVRAEEGGAHRDRPLGAQPARGAQRLRFVVEVEAVAGLDLDRGDAFGDQRVEARQRCAHKLVLARRARRLDRGDDAAAGPRDLLIGGAGKPHLELVGAVAGMDQMGVAVDQARRDPAAFAIDDLGTRGRHPRAGRFPGRHRRSCRRSTAIAPRSTMPSPGSPGASVASRALRQTRARGSDAFALSGHDFSIPIGMHYVYT